MARDAGRRRLKNELRRLNAMSPEAKREEGCRLLESLRKKAMWRAKYLTAPEVWALLTPKVIAIVMALDGTGDLLADIKSVFEEAIDHGAGLHLTGVSRPIPERARRAGL